MKAEIRGKSSDVGFFKIDQGADDGDAISVEFDFWKEACYLSFVKKVHKKSLGIVITMVAEGHRLAPFLFCHVKE